MISKKQKTSKKYKKINHIVSGLYKIKEINRRTHYSDYELKEIVLASPIGCDVCKGLIEEKIDIKWLIDNGFSRVAIVFDGTIK